MENNKPKTIEEFFIEKYERMETENKSLESKVELLETIEKNQSKIIEFWKNKYSELVERLKEDFGPEISEINSNETYFRFRYGFIQGNNEEKDKYYIDIFNLKEKGEEDNEQ